MHKREIYIYIYEYIYIYIYVPINMTIYVTTWFPPPYVSFDGSSN